MGYYAKLFTHLTSSKPLKNTALFTNPWQNSAPRRRAPTRSLLLLKGLLTLKVRASRGTHTFSPLLFTSLRSLHVAVVRTEDATSLDGDVHARDEA